VNPVFVLPGALEQKGPVIADGLFRSVQLGVGQFCTSPGLVFGVADPALATFAGSLIDKFHHAAPGTMLNPAICKAYAADVARVNSIAGVHAYFSLQPGDPERTESRPALLVTDSATWLRNHELHTEIFGPATVLVQCARREELLEIGSALEGSLTATVHGTAKELAASSDLVAILARKAGRLIFNGFPTGVEVGFAMHHGGPYPATTDEKFTSVGAAAIYRFARPLCYQGFPEHLLPPELQNANPRRIWRTVNGQLTRDPI
jgi:NADP-dependent aldehyde dehydrogenase